MERKEEGGRTRGKGKSQTNCRRTTNPPKLILKERNPWLTPTESCASDDTEEEEENLKRGSIWLVRSRRQGREEKRLEA